MDGKFTLEDSLQLLANKGYFQYRRMGKWGQGLLTERLKEYKIHTGIRCRLKILSVIVIMLSRLFTFFYPFTIGS